MSGKLILGAAIGDCVHVAGLFRFLSLAENEGYRTLLLGPAVPLDNLVRAICREKPELVGISYRLSPEAAGTLLADLRRALEEAGLTGPPGGGRRLRLAFGGTPPVARIARRTDMFEAVFDGREGDPAVIAYLRGGKPALKRRNHPQTLVERIERQAPYPLIRHHFGLPDYQETLKGVRRLADAGVIDVISLGVDQNTQEHFFRPEETDPRQEGAGGVPVRTPDQFQELYLASRRGNHPLMRSYSGTRDLIPMAAMLRETINQAWGAVPLMWYSRLDGRSNRRLETAIREAQATFAWHAGQGIPLECNEAHHWSLRDAPDAVAVAMAFLAAYNAKMAGVRHYVAQYMFNTPPGTSFAMDLAKMLAKIELIESLHDWDFMTYRQTRTGLTSMPADPEAARGHLAASILLQMAVHPHIVHVVAHVEADHAARPPEIIHACRLAHGVIRNALQGLPNMTLDPHVQARKHELIAEARTLLAAIRRLPPAPGRRRTGDPWIDPDTLARAVRIGLLDAPHLRGNPAARGKVATRVIDGCCRAVDPLTMRPLTEEERIDRLMGGGHACAASRGASVNLRARG